MTIKSLLVRINKDPSPSRVELVERFRKNFKKEIMHKLIQYIISKNVHLGEANQTNNMVNISFYNAMQGYYKTKITKIEGCIR